MNEEEPIKWLKKEKERVSIELEDTPDLSDFSLGWYGGIKATCEHILEMMEIDKRGDDEE